MSTLGPVASQQAFGQAVNNGDFAALDDLVAVDSVDHDPAPGQGPGPKGYKTFFTDMRTAFPDMHLDVDAVVADGELVAFAYTLTGTNNGPFHGHPATGKPVSIRGVQISRIRDGKLVERWGSSDELGLVSQLGRTGEQDPTTDPPAVPVLAASDSDTSINGADTLKERPSEATATLAEVGRSPGTSDAPDASVPAESTDTAEASASAEPATVSDGGRPAGTAGEPAAAAAAESTDAHDVNAPAGSINTPDVNGSAEQAAATDAHDSSGPAARPETSPLAAAAAAGPLPANADDFEVPTNREAVARRQDHGVIPIQDPDLDPEGVAQDTAGTSDPDETVTAINMRS